MRELSARQVGGSEACDSSGSTSGMPGIHSADICRLSQLRLDRCFRRWHTPSTDHAPLWLGWHGCRWYMHERKTRQHEQKQPGRTRVGSSKRWQLHARTQPRKVVSGTAQKYLARSDCEGASCFLSSCVAKPAATLSAVSGNGGSGGASLRLDPGQGNRDKGAPFVEFQKEKSHVQCNMQATAARLSPRWSWMRWVAWMLATRQCLGRW